MEAKIYDHDVPIIGYRTMIREFYSCFRMCPDSSRAHPSDTMASQSIGQPVKADSLTKAHPSWDWLFAAQKARVERESLN